MIRNGLYHYTVCCSLCDYESLLLRRQYLVFYPMEGVFESEIEVNYCTCCEKYTPWFMGKGVNDISPETHEKNLLELDHERKKIESFKLELVKLQILANKNFLYRFLYKKRINKLLFFKRASEVSYEVFKKDFDVNYPDYMDDTLYWNTVTAFHNRNNDILKFKYCEASIEYYKTLDFKPRCLHCGDQTLSYPPRHKCGGIIFLKVYHFLSKSNPSGLALVKSLSFYDNKGFIKKTEEADEGKLFNLSYPKVLFINKKDTEIWRFEQLKSLSDFKFKQVGVTHNGEYTEVEPE